MNVVRDTDTESAVFGLNTGGSQVLTGGNYSKGTGEKAGDSGKLAGDEADVSFGHIKIADSDRDCLARPAIFEVEKLGYS